MDNYSLSYPGKIIFGNGERRQLPSLLPAGAVLVICGRHSRKRIADELLPLLNGRKTELLSDINPEVPISDVIRACDAARRICASAVIGWGGGSAIDCAKAVAALAPCDGNAADYFYGRKKISSKGLFFAALPTTAGTGAEVTGNAVICDPETGIKQSLRGVGMVADLAIVDPELTFDCPPRVTAASGMDALTQGLESLISKKADTVSSALALQAVKRLFFHLEDACRNIPAAREAVAEGSMLAGLAFSSSGLGAVHGIGHPLGSICHIPHGVCCALLLPVILKWNYSVCREKLDAIAAELGLADGNALISAITALNGRLGIPANARSYGLSAEKFDFIVRNSRSGSMKCNPRDLSDADIIKILEELQ
ncbi:MAG: iron-containing alcohol dehydrogenase [Lentisphaeria bacterium]|nr:iron-containing alcohol dehydrogenase [Lentisphaeria bacterium]